MPTDEFNLQQYLSHREEIISRFCNRRYINRESVSNLYEVWTGFDWQNDRRNACQVGVRTSNGVICKVMFDWVSRITSSDYAE
ncbi:hypothetical protein KCP74_11635 [Salmonella enterica subsp. enterica]|nr:hypothetical protein KCP74_11635 [Salmonella enterica subsp. enterica]